MVGVYFIDWVDWALDWSASQMVSAHSIWDECIKADVDADLRRLIPAEKEVKKDNDLLY